MKNFIFKMLLIVTLLPAVTLYAGEGVKNAPSKKSYSLLGLYKIALAHSEQIKISEEDLYIAKTHKQKTSSALFPNFSVFGSYTSYDDEIGSETSDVDSYGILFQYAFTLNGKELTALELAKDNIIKGEFDLFRIKEDYLLQVAEAYYKILNIMKASDIAVANVKRLQKHEMAITQKLNIQEASKTDLYRTQAELSNAETEVIDIKNDLRLARLRLSSLVMLPGNFSVQDKSITENINFGRTLEDLQQQAFEFRVELKSLDMERSISEYEVKLAKSAYWPEVSLDARYVIPEAEASDFVYDENYSYVNLIVNLPIFDGGMKKAGVRESLSKKRKIELRYNEMKKKISLEVEHFFFLVANQKSKLKSRTSQLKLAKENFNSEKDKFKYGLSNSIDMMDANTLLVESEEKLAQEKYNYSLLLLMLEKAAGTYLTTIFSNM